MAVELDVVGAPAPADEARRPEPEALVHDAVEVRHRLQRVGRDGAAADDLVDLGLRLLPYARLGEEGLHRPRQRTAGRVVPRGDEAHDLVADLLIRQARFAVVVDRGQQHRQDVVAVTGGVGRATAGELGVDDSVGGRPGRFAAMPRRPRQVDLDLLLGQLLIDELEGGLEHVADLVRPGPEIIAEEGAPRRAAPTTGVRRTP